MEIEKSKKEKAKEDEVIEEKPEEATEGEKVPKADKDQWIDEGIHDVGGLLNSIVWEALTRRASDIHLEPTEKNLTVRYRIDGMLRQALIIDKVLEEALIFKIKISAKLPTDEHFAPLDGRIRFMFEQKHLDTRISIVPTTLGEKVVIRLLTQEGRSFALEDLGVEGKDLEIVKKSYIKPYGMILAVGPTGSGKTTTLYAILKLVNSPERNITTIEDPVEYNIEGVNHIQINVKTNLTFATGLRSILRQDPDIVMVGEIRDNETARIAINAALTGHLVLSTLHTNDSVTTIPRLIDMGIEPFLVSATVNVIVAQRLARMLCKECKKEYTLKKDKLDEIHKIRPDIAKFLKEGDKLHEKGECKECGSSGYKGRMGLFEVLEVTEAIRRLITDGANSDDIFKTARANGLILIVEDGIKKLKSGIIDLDELLRVTVLKE